MSSEPTAPIESTPTEPLPSAQPAPVPQAPAAQPAPGAGPEPASGPRRWSPAVVVAIVLGALAIAFLCTVAGFLAGGTATRFSVQGPSMMGGPGGPGFGRGFGGRGGFGGGPMMPRGRMGMGPLGTLHLASVVASLTRMTTTDVISKRASGTSYADIAKAKGVTVDRIAFAALNRLDRVLTALVDSGRITAGQKQRILDRARVVAVQEINASGPLTSGPPFDDVEPSTTPTPPVSST